MKQTSGGSYDTILTGVRGGRVCIIQGRTDYIDVVSLQVRRIVRSIFVGVAHPTPEALVTHAAHGLPNPHHDISSPGSVCLMLCPVCNLPVEL